MLHYFLLVCKGAVIGLANVIPGVSGGTMAVVMNIYGQLMESLNVSYLFKHFKTCFIKFLLPIGIGAAVAILGLGNLMDYLFTNHLAPTLYFFAGIILASIPVIYPYIGKDILKPVNVLFFFLGISVMVANIIFSVNPADYALQLGNSFLSILWYVFCGFIAAITMIIPGVSGSLVMTIIGVYPVIMEAIANLDFFVLLPFGAGVLTAFVVGTRFISLLLKHFPQPTYSVILGLVVGSAPALLFNRPSGGGAATFILPDVWSIVFMILGAALCLGFSLWERKREKRDTIIN